MGNRKHNVNAELLTAPAGNDLFHIVQGGKSYRITWDNLKAYAGGTYKPLISTKFTITPGQLATLFSSPVTLFSSIADGYRIAILRALIYYQYATAGYTDRSLAIYFNSISVANKITTASTFQNGTNNTAVVLFPLNFNITTNDNIIFGANADPGGAGGGSMILRVVSQLIAL